LEKGRVSCPFCGRSFEISEALYRDIEADLKAHYEKEYEKRFKEELEKKQEEWEKKAREIEAKFNEEKKILEEKIRKEIEGTQLEKLKLLEEQAKEYKKQLFEQQKKELEWIKEKEKWEKEKQEMELELTRKLIEERKKINEEAARQFEEKYQLLLAEKDRELKEVKEQVDELKRKTEQKSQQFQGEVLEEFLEEALRKEFPFDLVEPVKTGQKGADIIQTVRTQYGLVCGKILWETKRTKNWSDEWIDKLKDDQRKAKAELAVLVSEVLPKGVNQFDNIKGVWVSEIPLAVKLAAVLRNFLVQLARERKTQEGKEEKMEILYQYLTGPEFKNRVQAIMEAFIGLRNDLEAEKRAFERLWAKREKQINRVVTNLAGLRGDIEGLAGPLPTIKAFELPDSKEEDEEEG